MEHCKKCGQALQNSDQYCGVCGATVDADDKVVTRDVNTKVGSDAPQILNSSYTSATSSTTLLNGPESNLNGPLFSSDTSPARVPKPTMGNKAKIIIGALLAIVLAAGGFWGWLGYSSEARVQAKLELAIKYLSENDYEKAILEFNEAIKIDPRNIEARVGLAQAYIGIGDTQKADEVLTAAMSIGTLSPGQYQQVIEMYIKKGNYNEAAKLLAQARGQYPDNDALKAIEDELVLMGVNVSNSNMQINTLLKENPRSIPEGIFASLNPRSTKLRFYRSTVARKSIEISEDEYKTRFAKSAPSNIYFQLYSDVTPPEHEVFYEIKSILYKSDGSILDRGTVYCNVERNWHISSISLNDYNDSKGGYWEVGSYKVEAFIDGNLVATGSFEVY
ncbi:MAG: tetratricopeptide repeat protein [Syntrophomonas sp.]